jgi:hypothetical protein
MTCTTPGVHGVDLVLDTPALFIVEHLQGGFRFSLSSHFLQDRPSEPFTEMPGGPFWLGAHREQFSHLVMGLECLQLSDP